MAILTSVWLKLICRDLLIYRKTIIILLAPIVLLPFIFAHNANSVSSLY